MKSHLKRFTSAALSAVMVFSSVSGITASAAESGVEMGYESLFEGDNIVTINVEIADEDWDSILESPLDKDYKSVSVTINGETYENVGFSTKGNLTLNSVASMEDSDRYSFRIKFNKFDKEQTYNGLDKLALNNGYSDPSYLREYLHYEALRELGLDAPLTTFVNLYINGELYGFYLGVESIDKSYLERNYGSDYADGTLYEAESVTTLLTDEIGEYSTIAFDTGTEDDKATLKSFIEVLNAMEDGEKGDIESVLNVDTALKYIAANTVLGNYDSYNGDKGQNFYLYAGTDGVFSVVPWDFNMSFDGYMGGAVSGNASSTTTVSIDEPVYGTTMEERPLISKLLAVDEYYEEYLGYVNTLVDYLENIETRANELADLIRPYIEADPTKFYTMDDFESSFTYSTSYNSGGMGGGNMREMPEGMTFPTDGTAPTGEEPTDGADFGGTAPDSTAPMVDAPADGTAIDGVAPTGEMPADGTAPSATAPTSEAMTDFPEGMTAPEGMGGVNGGMGGNAQMSGSLITFTLNRLANLQEQLGREVISLPSEGSENTAATVETAATATQTADTAEGVKVKYNGTDVTFDVEPFILDDGRIYLTTSDAALLIGKWATASLVDSTDDSVSFTVDGTTITITAVQADDGTLLVQLKSLCDQCGKSLSWDSNTQTASIE